MVVGGPRHQGPPPDHGLTPKRRLSLVAFPSSPPPVSHPAVLLPIRSPGLTLRSPPTASHSLFFAVAGLLLLSRVGCFTNLSALTPPTSGALDLTWRPQQFPARSWTRRWGRLATKVIPLIVPKDGRWFCSRHAVALAPTLSMDSTGKFSEILPFMCLYYLIILNRIFMYKYCSVQEFGFFPFIFMQLFHLSSLFMSSSGRFKLMRIISRVMLILPCRCCLLHWIACEVMKWFYLVFILLGLT